MMAKGQQREVPSFRLTSFAKKRSLQPRGRRGPSCAPSPSPAFGPVVFVCVESECGLSVCGKRGRHRSGMKSNKGRGLYDPDFHITSTPNALHTEAVPPRSHLQLLLLVVVRRARCLGPTSADLKQVLGTLILSAPPSSQASSMPSSLIPPPTHPHHAQHKAHFGSVTSTSTTSTATTSSSSNGGRGRYQ